MTNSTGTLSADAAATRATHVASRTKVVGQLLDGQNTADAAAGMARSMATGAVNNTAQNWFSQYGTLQAGLSIDEDNSLANSSIDWLLPVYETPSNTLFNQMGFRNKDDRNTLNLGMGIRHISGNWMYGVNTFYDDDITGHNRRMGIGAEARTDYLQFASNTYLRLSGWQQSRDFADHDERPANGFDIRTQGWLPSYPQLGGKLVYEQYYGDEVALFGKDDRQVNPYAVTAGINWTPFPLLTLGVDERMGKDGKNETNVNLQLTWRPDSSLASQLSGSSVGASRLMSETRHDLVDRNNNIVLEYRKQQVIKLSLSNRSGLSGTADTLAAQVTGKYLPAQVSWDVSALLAAGGIATPSTSDQQVLNFIYPPYNPGGINSYTITATAQDSKGNISPVSRGVITVIGVSNPSTTESTLDATPLTIKANGRDASTITLTLKNENGNAITGQVVTFISSLGSSKFDGVMESPSGSGVYIAKLTGSTAGEARVTASVNGTALGVAAKMVTLTADSAASSVTALSSDVDTQTVGKSITFTATLKDANGNAVPDADITFTTDKGTLGTPSKTDSNGQATVTLTDTVAGVATVMAKSAVNAADSGQTKAVTFVAGEVAGEGYSTLTVDPASIVANGTAISTLTFKAKDVFGNPVTGAVVEFNVVGVKDTKVSNVNENNGVYTATLSGRFVGVATVTVTANSTAVNGLSASITLTTPEFAGVSVNGTTFGLREEVPTTGFTGAEFTLTLSEGAASDYDWKSSASSWSPVDSRGKVRFISKGDASPVTITATPKEGGTPMTYTFSVGSWFTNSGSATMEIDKAYVYCSASGTQVPNLAQLTKGKDQRGAGSLWSEWGSMGNYPGSGFMDVFYWTSSIEATGAADIRHYVVNLEDGFSIVDLGGISIFALCSQGL
ncbi:inverse autotransporter beta domain-containing protein [Citrobacter meridianamericanus]|uniref:inverse autotransporter beta domain-containing protein n=1 Tax=Citrobacter meridianamericanus TaxID=2894201 RepID=UPI0025923464|nr:inverse autotransporter beta domain-containing protein [uncultured Citrobacter sp.]